jgi:Skp family chaperone for outer membrane proteins
MVVSTRGILAIGLGLAGLAFLVGPLRGQAQDGQVRKAASPAAGQPAAPIAPIVGTIDVDAVFKGYEKWKVTNNEFQAAVLARQNDLMKLKSEAQEVAQMLNKLTPGTGDFKTHEDKVTELKARFEAGREQAQREFALREAENVATIYKEVQAMVGRIAQWRKMNYIFKVTSAPIAGTDPSSVMNAINSTVVYSDTHNDITNDVVFNLNRMYKATAGPAPRVTSGTAGPGNAANPAQPDGN